MSNWGIKPYTRQHKSRQQVVAPGPQSSDIVNGISSLRLEDDVT